MAKPRRKKRTRIRTAAGTVQRAFLERLRALRDDPLRALPDCPDGEPKPIAKVHRRLERIAAGKVGFFDRRDKGVVGAVAHAVELASLESVPRLVDQRVAGKRRFYLQRGHVSSLCSLGVQNHDDPLALIAAWRDTAAKEGLHFFAGGGFWCTGDRPTPPPAWWDDLAKATSIPLAAADGEPSDRACPHTDEARVELRFPDGPGLTACASCIKKAGNLHGMLMERHAGPERRRPVQVRALTATGQEAPMDRQDAAAFRAGALSAKALLKDAIQQWRGSAHEQAFLIGQHQYPDQEAFLDALADAGARPWEIEALRVMTRDGHAGPDASVDRILRAHRDRFPHGVQAVLGADAERFMADQGKAGPRDILRLAHEEARHRDLLDVLPRPRTTGPMGRWVDRTARHARTHDRRETLDRLRKDATTGEAPAHHVGAFLDALDGSSVGIAGADEHPAAWTRLAEHVLEREGTAYLEALQTYLERTGTGETAERAH